MKRRSVRRGAAAALVAGTLAATGAFAVSTSGQDPPRRDEFGVIPEDGTDKDLILPDPILDRSWPSPRPGDNVAPPPAVAPDEDEIDPFDEEDLVPAPPPAEEDEDAEEQPVEPPPPPARVAPDARSPLAEPAPEAPEILEPEVREPAGLEEQEAPSPLEQDDEQFRNESGDPGDW